MENKAPVHARDRFARDTDASEHRLRREIGPIRLTVRGFDRGMVDQTSQSPARGAIPIRRRRPFDLLDRATGSGDGVRKRFEPQVEHPGALLE